MQSRFAIILMSVAGAGALFCVGLLFGLGVMSSPKGGQHKEITVTNEPVRVARRETTGSAGTADRPLTPLTPVHPGTSEPAPAAAAKASGPQVPVPAQPPAAPAAQAATQPAVSAPAQGTAVAQKPIEPAAKEAKLAPAPQPVSAKPASSEKPASAPRVEPEKEAKLAPAPKPLPAKDAASATPAASPADTTPVALHKKNSCEVDACARAYKSFRESDCSYQPYSGPRQLCVSPPAPAKEASRGDEKSASVRVHRGNQDVDVQNVPRDRARLTDGASPRDEDGPAARREFRRDIAADGEDDGIDDSRVIVRRGGGDRSYDGGGWHRSFFAPVDDDDDDQ